MTYSVDDCFGEGLLSQPTIPYLRREGAASVRRRNASPSAVDRWEREENKGRIGALCTGVAPGMVGRVVSASVVSVLL